MKISWNWLSELVDLSGVGGPEKLAEILTSRGLEVEEIHSQAKGFDRVITAQVLEKKQHPQADRLSVCKVSTGSGEPLDIVCGAQNFKAGDKVVLAQVGAHLPNGMKIAQGKIRGEISNGMLCSEEELGLKAESEGILLLPENVKLGQVFADYLQVNDTILTFKLTANRADCLSHFGMAREVAAALGKEAKRPESASLDLKSTPISVALEAGENAPQFWGCYIEGVKIGPSPDWLVKRLEAVGSRSINNVVDATNYVMLELGHPMHAYDADKIEGKKIGVRMSKSGEELPPLDGTQVKLTGEELVIFDGARAVGLAGVMGGGNSEIQDSTTRVFLECAEFNPSLIRRASSRFQRKTDAAHRFERGIDPNGAGLAIARMAQMIVQLAGGKITSSSVTAMPSRDPKKGAPLKQIRVNPAYFGEFLGMDLTIDQIERVLKSEKCQIEKSGNEWTVTVPSYRLDLSMKEDLAEEIARSVGYDKIPSTIPILTSAPRPQLHDLASARLVLMDRAKEAMTRAGLMETVNYSWANRAWLKEFGMESSARVLNPLSEDHEALVPSLLPNLVKNAVESTRHHFGSEPLAIRLFELRPTFHAAGEVKAVSETETGVQEKWKLAFAVSGPRFAAGLRNEQGEVDFYDLKTVAESLFEALSTRGIRLQPLAGQSRPAATAKSSQAALPYRAEEIFHPGQTVEIWAGGSVAGHLGLLHPGLAKALKLRAPLWLMELDWDSVSKLSRPASESRSYKAWSEFPPMERDFALVVKEEVTADKITQVALKAGKPLAKVAKIFDIYRGSQVPKGMTSVAVRVIFFHEGRSLQEQETEAASTQILEAWKKELGAELRG